MDIISQTITNICYFFIYKYILYCMFQTRNIYDNSFIRVGLLILKKN